MSLVEKVTRRSMVIRPSGRSTDFITPSFIMGCGFNCSYCYCKRHKPTGWNIAKNTLDILTEINHHVWFADVEKPNQTGDFITYDIGCNTDVALHAKDMNWETIFKFFRDHPLAMGSFATKYVNEDFLTFNPEGKIRIRFSLMPEDYRAILEPNTSRINQRLLAVRDFLDAGYEVHLNFSPVIVWGDWLNDYARLFRDIKWLAQKENWNNDAVKAEVIFLTHNEAKHKHNLEHNLPGEDLLWKPEIQESKVSQYGGKNIRYKHDLKAEYIKQWLELHDKILPWNTVRYAF